MTTKKIHLTGIRATGQLHIGHYLAVLEPMLATQEAQTNFLTIVDLHALTTTQNPAVIRESTYDVAATWIACGLDIRSHALWRQSDLPQVTQLQWYLSCVTGMGFLEKAHAYKDKVSEGAAANVGLFNYPVLMAADILLYEADVVPVGKDQKQHVEMARDMAGSFNAVYGEGLVKVPEVLIQEDVMLITGLDGRKMSKSYNNTIPLFTSAKELRKLCLSLKTDSTSLESPKTMKGTALGDLFALFATPSETADLEARLQKGGLGWGHAKDELSQAIDRKISPFRKIFEEIRPDTAFLDKTLAEGAAKAAVRGEPVLKRVRQAVGFRG